MTHPLFSYPILLYLLKLKFLKSLNAHNAKGADQLNLETYLGVSHLSGVSVSILIILWSETDQPSYLVVNMFHNVQERYTDAVFSESRVLTDSFQC